MNNTRWGFLAGRTNHTKPEFIRRKPTASKIILNTVLGLGSLILLFPSWGGVVDTTPESEARHKPQMTQAVHSSLIKIDFQRGSRGEGQIVMQFDEASLPVTESVKQGKTLILRLANTDIQANQERALDLQDFATPIKKLAVTTERQDAVIHIELLSDDYEYIIKPEGKRMVVIVRSSNLSPDKGTAKQKPRQSADKISVNFQDIPVRSVLQILADFAAINIIASDTVEGNLTLRLDDIPWEDALNLVLKSRALGKHREDNAIWVAPLEEIHKAEKDELEARQALEELEPLKTEIIPVNYTTAEELKKVLIGTTRRTNTTTGQGAGIGGSSVNQSVSTLDQGESILSARGNVTADSRTNQLIIKDTPYNLERIRELVRQLDRPIRQVLIESRIVIASNDFTRELGSRLSLNRPNTVKKTRDKTMTQTLNGQTTEFAETWSGNTAQSMDALVDLASVAAAGSGGAFGLSLLKAGDYLLDLELSAAQLEGRGEIISTPRLITADHTKASIKQGVEIPYQVFTASGGGSISNIQFKEAVLQLDVTPSIAPDDNVLMQLTIKKDAKGQDTTAGPTIDKREIETTAQVGNGETVVLGGVFEGTRGNMTHKVPFLGDLPGIGFMFRRNTVSDTKRELLIFITPKILKNARDKAQ